MILNFSASVSVSAMHAARAMAAGRTLIDPRLDAAVRPAAEALLANLTAAGADTAATLEHLVPLAGMIEGNRELARAALTKTAGRAAAERHAAAVAGAIAALEQAMLAAVSDLAGQLALRGQPLLEQWEARGPGLLAGIARRTEAALLAETAQVVLVQPVIGGSGRAYLTYNQIVFEAVLANPRHDLPEVARLAWLAAQLQHEAPIFGERVPPARLPTLAALAMLPATLVTAADIELVTEWPKPLPAALETWLAEDEPLKAMTAQSPAPLTDILDGWWQTYLERRPAWAVALEALDRMLAA